MFFGLLRHNGILYFADSADPRRWSCLIAHFRLFAQSPPAGSEVFALCGCAFSVPSFDVHGILGSSCATREDGAFCPAANQFPRQRAQSCKAWFRSFRAAKSPGRSPCPSRCIRGLAIQILGLAGRHWRHLSRGFLHLRSAKLFTGRRDRLRRFP